MGKSGLQLSARAVSDLLAKIIGPAYYDGPKFGRGDPGWAHVAESLAGRVFGRGSEVMLNPQPLPPREFYALSLADAHIQQVLSLDAAAAMLGGEAAKRALDRSQRLIDEIDDLCPKWPKWPGIWPPPPPPPWKLGDEMTSTELFLFGSRFLGAADLISHEKIQGSLAGLGEKALTLSTQAY